MPGVIVQQLVYGKLPLNYKWDNMKIKKCIYINDVDLDGNTIPNKPICVKTTLQDDTELIVPLDPYNTEYTEIMRQVKSGKITIAPADEE
jgi:hypothetical protein